MAQVTVDLLEDDIKKVESLASTLRLKQNKVLYRALAIGLEALVESQEATVAGAVAEERNLPTNSARENVDTEARKKAILAGFGLWKGLQSVPKDGLAFQLQMRSEWN